MTCQSRYPMPPYCPCQGSDGHAGGHSNHDWRMAWTDDWPSETDVAFAEIVRDYE